MQKTENGRFSNKILQVMTFVLTLTLSACSMKPDLKQEATLFAKAPYPLKTLMHQSEVGRLRLMYAGDTAKPLLVFIHGSPGRWDDYAKYMQDSMLLTRYCIASVDRPGFGGSDYGKPMVSLADQATLVYQAIRQLTPLKPFRLVGHSYGGPLATRITMDHPEAVAHLYLLAAAIDPAQEKKEWFRPVFRSLGFLLPDALEVSNDELSTLKADLELMMPLWPRLTMPITMLHGTEDMLVPYANTAFASRMLSHNKQFKLISIAKANHFIPWSHQAIVMAALGEGANP